MYCQYERSDTINSYSRVFNWDTLRRLPFNGIIFLLVLLECSLMLVLFHFGSVAPPTEMSWNYPPHPSSSSPLQHIERCYQSRSDSSALLYLLCLLWSECEAPHIQTDERLQISVSSISRAEQTLAQRGRAPGGGSRLICKVNALVYLSWHGLWLPTPLTPPTPTHPSEDWWMNNETQEAAVR